MKLLLTRIVIVAMVVFAIASGVGAYRWAQAEAQAGHKAGRPDIDR